VDVDQGFVDLQPLGREAEQLEDVVHNPAGGATRHGERASRSAMPPPSERRDQRRPLPREPILSPPTLSYANSFRLPF
jgi:hypothetical protein